VTLAKNTLAALVAAPPLCDLSRAIRQTIVNWPVELLCQRLYLPLVRR
jgi:hypothetical protein